MTSKEVNLASVPGDSGPIPPRFWWLKRILLAAGLLLVLLVVLRLWWGWYASRQLQAEIDRIIAAGEPIYPEDFDPKEVIPDDQNAAILLQRAAETYKLSGEQEQAFFAVFDHHKPITNHLDAIRTIYVDNAEPFGLIRQARDLPKSDWGVRFRSPVSAVLPTLSQWRVFAKLLCLRAEMHYVQNEDVEAAEALLDNLGLVRVVAATPSLISQMVTWAISELGIGYIEHFVIPRSQDARQVDPKLIREMIRQLLDSRPLHDSLVRAFEVERMESLDLLKELESGRTTISSSFTGWTITPHANIPDWVWQYVLMPQLRLDMVRVLQKASRQVEAIGRNSLGHSDLVINEELSATLSDVLREPFENWLFIHRAVPLYVRCEASRRVAAVGLALRLYRADHGRLPARLEELVPDYLDALPLDPSANEARSFGYLPKATSPIVYSVGRNGVDDGGQYEVVQGHVSRHSLDTPFFINGDRPVPLVANEPSESNSENENDADDEKQDEGKENQEGDQSDQGHHQSHKDRSAAISRRKPGIQEIELGEPQREGENRERDCAEDHKDDHFVIVGIGLDDYG